MAAPVERRRPSEQFLALLAKRVGVASSFNTVQRSVVHSLNAMKRMSEAMKAPRCSPEKLSTPQRSMDKFSSRRHKSTFVAPSVDSRMAAAAGYHAPSLTIHSDAPGGSVEGRSDSLLGNLMHSGGSFRPRQQFLSALTPKKKREDVEHQGVYHLLLKQAK